MEKIKEELFKRRKSYISIKFLFILSSIFLITTIFLSLIIDDAYLWDYRAKDNVLINCETITELK